MDIMDRREKQIKPIVSDITDRQEVRQTLTQFGDAAHTCSQ